MIVTLTKDNFQEEVMNSDIPVVVDFWASWCGPCKMLGPVIGEVAAEYDGKVKFGKVNIDEQIELAGQYGVMTIPTCIKFISGDIAKKTVGVFPKAQLIAQLGL